LSIKTENPENGGYKRMKIKCNVCDNKITRNDSRKDYIERDRKQGGAIICHSCIDRYYGGITAYRKRYGHTQWRSVPKREKK
jgi:hypothetical protein